MMIFMRKTLILRKQYLAITIILTIMVCFAAGTAAASEGEPKGWVETDSYRIFNFLILAAALIFLIKKFNISDMVNSRITDIENQLIDLETKKKDAQEKLAEYNEKISSLETKAEKIIADYTKQGEDAKARILEEAEAAAAKLEEQAQRTIEHEFTNAKLKLQKEITEKALDKAEELVKVKITSEDQDRLVDEYLNKVVA